MSGKCPGHVYGMEVAFLEYDLASMLCYHLLSVGQPSGARVRGTYRMVVQFQEAEMSERS